VERGNPASESRYWDPYLQTNGRRQVHSGEFGPDVVHRFVIDFIRRHRDRPFLVYYPEIIAHEPIGPTPLNRQSPPREPEQLYAGLVSYLDHLVGDLTRALDEAGLAERTFVFFMADNGSPIGGGRIGEIVFPKGKSLLNDAGVHVPLAVRGPGISPHGRGVAAPADLSDIFPTLLELAGVAPPRGVTIDGRSLVPVLRGGESPREWAFTQLGTRRSIRDRRFKLDSDGAFWDLLRDPLEAHELRDREPEQAGTRERLGRLLAALPSDAPPPFAPFGRRAVQAAGGRVPEP
jgi:arylsulfatase A-like enzyme